MLWHIYLDIAVFFIFKECYINNDKKQIKIIIFIVFDVILV